MIHTVSYNPTTGGFHLQFPDGGWSQAYTPCQLAEHIKLIECPPVDKLPDTAPRPLDYAAFHIQRLPPGKSGIIPEDLVLEDLDFEAL